MNMNWKKAYQEKVTSGAEAMAVVQSGNRVYIGGGAGVPTQLIDALVDRAPELQNVELTHILTFAEAPYAAERYKQHFRVNALFIGGNVRRAVAGGWADFTPIFLSDIPSLFQDGTLPLDVALIMLSPPDEHGFCSYGVEVGTSKPAAELAKIIIAQINRQMPRTYGDSFIHVNRLDHIVETDCPLPETPQGGTSPEHIMVGQHIAELIPDGATLQMGIGSIPDAVLRCLTNHKNLGIHTELFSDGVIDLVEEGIVTCSEKTFHPGKIVAGFLFGSERLYRFADNNPMIEMQPTHYVNDPFNIARNNKMVAINSAVQVDLTGQICADSIGTRFYSGAGGQVDFIRGASRSPGGLPIIAFLSTAQRGKVSRIVPTLYEGSGVVTTRNDVHMVVTEFGVAHLRGRSIRERTHALIKIAHPTFRDELSYAARQLRYI